MYMKMNDSDQTKIIWAEDRMESLLMEFKIRKLIPKDWTWGWNKAKTLVGLCDFDNKKISLSIHYVPIASEAEIEETIRHEIAHIIAGIESGHNETWKKACKLTGALPQRCTDFTLPGKYVAKCKYCGTLHYLHRKIRNMTRRYCIAEDCVARYQIPQPYLKYKPNPDL